MKRTLGTCYYPEHWPQEIWEKDARAMADLGLTWVRIGEFAWSRLEPVEGDLHFDWLDQAIEILGSAGLQVVLGTPTATPPRWVVDKYPDMLAHDAQGRPRGFGSRRHYCFSHQGYRNECARIVTQIAQRYGHNPYVAAWQTDNEYGCHETTVSYSPAAKAAFQNWLRAQYPGQGNDGDIEALNAAWGNVFWSMEYNSFDQIELPNLTVTEPNPAHVLDFRRFASDQVVTFNRLQVDIIRRHSDAPIAHNYMGGVTDFDHFKVGDDLEISSWDSYPLGFLEDRVPADDAHKTLFYRQGDPDYQAFHHDLYRAVGRGRWWVMEQQPGPVNWAPYNPAPLSGMVRLWTWEAFAHGAEAVCYFRWRQAPMAQEQMHAGLLRPDSHPAPAHAEATQVATELKEAGQVSMTTSPVAMVFDYEADWSWQIQPQGKGLRYLDIVFDMYRAFRRLGVDVDIVPPTVDDLSGYSAVVVPALMHVPDALNAVLQATPAQILYGPRTAARDAHFSIPTGLPPALPDMDMVITHVETFRPTVEIALEGGGTIRGYREHFETKAAPVLVAQDGGAVACQFGNKTYLGAVLDGPGLARVATALCADAGIQTWDLPQGVRTRCTGQERFWFNHLSHDVEVYGRSLPPAGVLREPLA